MNGMMTGSNLSRHGRGIGLAEAPWSSDYQPWSDADYRDLCKSHEGQLAELGPDEAESVRWRNNAYRLSGTLYRIRDRLHVDMKERDRIVDLHPAALDLLVSQRQARVRGLPTLPRYAETDFMLMPEELEEIGMQCLPDYMAFGYRDWDWDSPTSLTAREFSAVEQHLDLCYGCAFEFKGLAEGNLMEAEKRVGKREFSAARQLASRVYILEKTLPSRVLPSR